MARRNGGFIGTDGLDAPDPPTGVSVSGVDTSLSVSFTAPTDTGTSAITGFVAQLSTDDTAYSAGSNTGTSSPIVISSLTSGTNYTAKVWAINAYGTSAPSDASSAGSPSASRAVFGGGQTQNVMQYIAIATTGNATDFGDLIQTAYRLASCSSSTRGIFAGGNTGVSGTDNVIQYITVSTTGNATNFGDLTVGRQYLSGCNSSTRGLFGGGSSSSGGSNVIDFITIASTGNATDFGNLLSTKRKSNSNSTSSPTRGIWAGGSTSAQLTDIDYVTIATTGNAADFGNLSVGGQYAGACGSAVRGVVGGGIGGTNRPVTIDYITIATTGNATDFGDLTHGRESTGAAANTTRGLWGGGENGGDSDVIDYVTIASTGNATDFGDLLAAKKSLTALSNANGGTQ